MHNRDSDVESFKIRIDRNNMIHGDPDGNGNAISYYLIDYGHPVVFVNTSNHAMAEHDANQKLWKWVYVPGVMDSPLILGSKTRKEIDAEFDRGQANKT
ncbi:MAG: hypothetical protein PHN61_14165 [Methanothrix sp.]|nr:hypothetical protein [Methanothrix sp.]